MKFKSKTATTLTIVSTFMMVIPVMITYMALSFSFEQKIDKLHDNLLYSGIEFITKQIKKNIPYEEIKYPHIYFVIYDENDHIIYNNLDDFVNEGQFKNIYYDTLNLPDSKKMEVYHTVEAEEQAKYIILSFIFPMIIAVFFCYVVSSLIIDRTLNPVRVMIEKVKAIGNRNFKGQLLIDSNEDELQEYAHVFNEMSNKLDDYIDRQKQFVSDASHELTTPITVILGHTNMLLRWGKDDKDLLESELQIIKDEAIAMNELIENLLFFARTDNEKINYQFEEVDISKLLFESISDHRMLHPEFNFLFDYNESLILNGDYDALKQVIRILFANSVKYSLAEKEISVMIEKIEKSVTISISDRGIGMHNDDVDKIFDRFYRIEDSRTRETGGTGGTGLGLAIAKEIIQAHKGSILVQSKLNEGTKMIIHLPLE